MVHRAWFARVRGAVLRTAYSRVSALVAGVALVAVAAALWWRDFAWASWLTDGVALVLGATGLAFIVAALQGRRGDWDES